MPDLLTLENRVAVVTGGGRGIGRAIAHELARRGAAVVINDKSGEGVVCAEINDAGGKASCFQADISDFSQAQNLIKFTVDTFGDLHILVNNAGITRDGLILTMSEADWDAVLTVNLKGTFNCSKAAVKHMIRKRYGRIISIASVAGKWATPDRRTMPHPKPARSGLPNPWRARWHREILPSTPSRRGLWIPRSSKR